MPIAPLANVRFDVTIQGESHKTQAGIERGSRVDLVARAIAKLMDLNSQIRGYVVSGDGHYIVASMHDGTMRAICVVLYDPIRPCNAMAKLGCVCVLTMDIVRAGMESSGLTPHGLRPNLGVGAT